MRTDPSKVIPLSGATAEQWIVFHKALKSWFGKNAANAYFLKFWSQRGGAGSPADTHGLREYMDTQEVDLTTTWKGEVTDGAIAVWDFAGNAAKTVGIIILSIAALAVGLVVYVIVKGTNRITAPKQAVNYSGDYSFPNAGAHRGLSNLKLLS